MTGMWIYADVSLREALQGPYDTPEPQYRAAIYVQPLLLGFCLWARPTFGSAKMITSVRMTRLSDYGGAVEASGWGCGHSGSRVL